MHGWQFGSGYIIQCDNYNQIAINFEAGLLQGKPCINEPCNVEEEREYTYMLLCSKMGCFFAI